MARDVRSARGGARLKWLDWANRVPESALSWNLLWLGYLLFAAKSGLREGAGRLAHFRTTTNNGDSFNSRLACIGSGDRAHFGDFAVLSHEQRHSRGAAN
jgi:hypothetical protein